MFKNASEVMSYIEENNVHMVDFKTVDLFGRWRHLSTPASHVTKEVLEEGFGFDGSSYGFKKVNDSDMIMKPDLSTGFMDFAWEGNVLAFICNIHTTDEKESRFEQDPRWILEKAEKALYDLGIGNELLLGPEYEFYVFDEISFADNHDASYFKIGSAQSPSSIHSRTQELGNSGYHMPLKAGYHGEQPEDLHADFRASLVAIIEKMGVGVKYHHHEVGGFGQMEIETEMGTPLFMADATMKIKYAVKNYARMNQLSATFMPKPMFGLPGNGLHVHFQLLKDKVNAFAGKKYAGMNENAIYFITGILKHAKALSAFANPSTNSYKRLVPGYEAPVSAVFAKSNRSAAIRIPGYVNSDADRRFEYRAGDATANPYLMFAAMIMAGIDGIKNKIAPESINAGPYDGSLYDLTSEEQKKINTLPRSLGEAFDCLEKDAAFLLNNDVFPQSIITTWIQRKKELELNPTELRPHPYEFITSYNC